MVSRPKFLYIDNLLSLVAKEIALSLRTLILLWTSISRSLGYRAMNWIQRKIYLYNVTFGLFMLDWWERYLFNILVIVLMWFIFYNGSRYVTDFFQRHLILSSDRSA
ncbi:Protein of unknown function (DUF3317) [Melia azedarach]|uniref:Uncharacterized protein n=1 Tax=Melia azedarach TaxID=155640 RepID=A0ACC1WS73_MELAZ|nr:Protein of unknown function (DUF3317) [Melia azedarach]